MATSGQRAVGVVLKAVFFLVCVWGTAVIIGGHSVLVHPSRHFEWLASSLRGGGKTTSPSDPSSSSLVGDPSRFVLDPDWDFDAPPTTRIYDWTVSEVLGSPGHIQKRMLVVNGLSPGPTIEANLGDRIIVNVVNQLENATVLHWHGLFQNGTNYYDGAHGITQCGIPPHGGRMTYNFTVQNVGSYWWHAHCSSQRVDGLYGAMILHSPSEPARTTVPYDGEVVFLLSDLYNTFSQTLLWRYLRFGTGINGQPGDEPTPDGGSINGISQARCAYMPATNSVLPERRRRSSRGRIGRGEKRNPGEQMNQPLIPESEICAEDGDDEYSVVELEKGKSYRMRLVNAAAFTNIFFSIDRHTLTIVEADGVSVEPREVEQVLLAPAQRYSVIVKLDQSDEGAFWIRTSLDEDQLTYTGPHLNTTTLGVLRYKDAAVAKVKHEVPDDDHRIDFAPLGRHLPRSTPHGPSSGTGRIVKRDADYLHDLIPLPKELIPEATDRVSLTISMQYTADGDYLSFFNSTSWSPLPDSSTLELTQSSLTPSLSTLYSHEHQLTHITSSVSSQEPALDIILNNLDDGVHPFHLHGHTFTIVASGPGRWMDPRIAEEFMLDKSMYDLSGDALNEVGGGRRGTRRDTVLMRPYSFVVLRVHGMGTNPGLWAFHCHITWHLESGLMMQFASLPGLENLHIPDDVKALCPSPVS